MIPFRGWDSDPSHLNNFRDTIKDVKNNIITFFKSNGGPMIKNKFLLIVSFSSFLIAGEISVSISRELGKRLSSIDRRP